MEKTTKGLLGDLRIDCLPNRRGLYGLASRTVGRDVRAVDRSAGRLDQWMKLSQVHGTWQWEGSGICRSGRGDIGLRGVRELY